MIGELATSKAGHDKDRLYMIVGEEGECVYLCDGRLRGVEHPKKKKKKTYPDHTFFGTGHTDPDHKAESSGGAGRDRQTDPQDPGGLSA